MLVPAINQWGRKDGLEPQRADLWVVDLTQAFLGIMGRLGTDTAIRDQEEYSGLKRTLASYARRVNPVSGNMESLRYYAASVTIPEMTINPEVTRKDSRPYNVPGFDTPLGAIRMTFIHDASKTLTGEGFRRSEIYALLNLWRMLVRAGRGGMSSEFALSLDKEFKVNYGFDVSVKFLGGQDPEKMLSEKTSDEGLNITSTYVLKNCWISSLGISELSYNEARQSNINASFYADDIFTENAQPELLDAGTPFNRNLESIKPLV